MAKNNSQNLKSFSFPFVTLSEVDVEQPVFGANNLRGKVRAQPDGGWRGEAKFKIVFKSGGAIEFATGMMKAIQLAKQMSGAQAAWAAPPPAYFDVAGGAMPAPPMYYNQPANYYGWAPPAYNFPPPEAGSVFISEAPPPYPGIGGFGAYPQQPAYAPQNPGAYPSQPPPAYTPNPAAGAGYPYPPASAPNNPTSGMANGNGNIGFYPPPQTNFAYADSNGGGQAYVPSPGPPPYAPPPMMNKKND
jgi:hypothetical protein